MTKQNLAHGVAGHTVLPILSWPVSGTLQYSKKGSAQGTPQYRGHLLNFVECWFKIWLQFWYRLEMLQLWNIIVKQNAHLSKSHVENLETACQIFVLGWNTLLRIGADTHDTTKLLSPSREGAMLGFVFEWFWSEPDFRERHHQLSNYCAIIRLCSLGWHISDSRVTWHIWVDRVTWEFP